MSRNLLFRARVSRFALTAICFLIGIGSGKAPAADMTATWNNTAGNWSDATRWSTGPLLFPNNGNGGFTYDAVIGGGTVTLDQNIMIEALNLNGGTLTGAAATNFTLTLNDSFTWTAGTIGGPGSVIANDGITISGALGKTLGSGGNTGRTLVNNGVANFSGATLNISSSGGANPGSVLQNNGTFNALDEADIGHNNFGGPAGAFANAGTFNKSGVGTTTSIGTLFNNSGTVNVDEGTLELSGGGTSTGGTIAVDAGATLRFAGGTYTMNGASSTTGAGDMTITNGTITFDGAYTVTGITTVSGGTANFNTPAATLTTLNFSNGTVGGTGSQNITTAFNWTGGTLGGTATTTVDNTAMLTISGTMNKTLGSGGNTGRTLVNNGIANFSGATLLISSSGGANPGSVLQNNGTFNALDEADIQHNNFGGPAGAFTNAGAFNKSGVGTITDVSPLFNNSGTVNVDEGTLQLSGGGTSTGGTFAVDAGATLRFAGGTQTMDGASSTTGAGDVTFAAGTTTVDGAYTVSGITTVSGGTANFNTPAATLTTLNLASGTVGGTGSQNITTAFNWTGGTLAGTATTTVDNTAMLTISGTMNKTLGSGGNTGRTLVNNGIANFSGATLLISSSGGANPGSMLQNNGTFNVTDEADIQHNNFGGPAGAFANAGTFNKSGLGTTTDISTLFNNSGTVNVDQGTLSLSGGGTSPGGTFAVDAGATLRFAGGTHTMDNASSTTGAGDVTFSGGTTTVDGTYNIGGVTTVSGGTANFNTPAAVLTTLNVSGGTMGGTGAQNVTSAFNWTGGTLGGSGTTTVDNTATLTISGAVNKTLGNGGNTGRTLVNNGVANLSGLALLISSSGGAAPGSLFQNNGTFNVTDEADIQHNNFGGPAGSFTNAGTFNKSGVGTTTDISTQFTNTGTVNVNEGTLAVSGPFTNYNAGTDTLTGGTYNVTGTFRFLNADINTNRASITLNGPASQIVDQSSNNALVDFALNDTGAFFGITGNRNFTTTAAFTNRGQVQIGGGTFDAASIVNDATGEFFGFGTIADSIANSGVVRAAGGTLVMGGIIDGQSGTIQIDPGASLDLSGSGGDSDADFLLHNGTNLNLGANDVLVADDYNNVNFGVGNSFNPRANVTGTGQINADPSSALGLSDAPPGGLTFLGPNLWRLGFGNIHVGSSKTLSYHVANQSGVGPSLRGAIQTTVNGGNLTDARLSGLGATAGNFGPLAPTALSGNLPVTFDGLSAGTLAGQQLRILDNFDNVDDLILQLTGAAYRLANPTGHTPEPVNFGNLHVGDPAPSQTLSITNNVPADGFSESLNASIGSPTGGVIINGGSFTALAPGVTDSSSLSVGIDTATPGNKSGTATIALTSNGAGSSGLGLTPLAAQTVNVTGSVFRLADPVIQNTLPIDFGIVHVGDTVAQIGVDVLNNAAADGFSENLNASFGPVEVGVTTNGGAISGLAPQASNTTNMTVGIDTSTALVIDRTAFVEFQSDGTGINSLGQTDLPIQILQVRGQVNNFAVADLLKIAGDGTFGMTGANEFTLNLGTVIMGQPNRQAELGVVNDVLAPADDLAGNFTLMAPDFMLTGFDPFTGLAAGSTHGGLFVELDTSTVGMFSGQITLSPRSTNPRPFSMDLAPITIRLLGEVQPIPEPASLMILIALMAFAAPYCRLRR